MQRPPVPIACTRFQLRFRAAASTRAKYIREVSHHFGTNHTEFDLNTDAELADAIQQIAYYSDEPSADAGAVPLWFLAKMTARDVTVILTGEGGDELFAGYLTYKRQPVQRHRAEVSRPW